MAAVARVPKTSKYHLLLGLTGPAGQAKEAKIQISTPLQLVSLLDLLQYQGVVDGPYLRTPGSGPLNLVTLNLGYMESDSRLSIKTLNADSFRRLPFLKTVYSYDLNLTDFYQRCGRSFEDYLNLQIQACADTLFLDDMSPLQLPRLPFLCHTPYYPPNLSRDFIDEQSRDLTRLHILNWVLNETITVPNITFSADTDVDNSTSYTTAVSQVTISHEWHHRRTSTSMDG